MPSRFTLPARGGRVLLLAWFVTSCAGCAPPDLTDDPSSRSLDLSAGAPAVAATPVVSAPVAIKAMPLMVDAVGTVEPIATVEVRSQVTGQVREIRFTPGDEVRPGQPLFTLDPRPFEAAVRQAQAVVARDTAQASAAKAQRTRYADLFNRGLIPRDQFEAQTATASALDATLAADQAQLEQARLNLQYTRITAPIGGRTGAPLVHVGDLIRANDATALVTINQMSPIDVTFAVPARLLVDVRRYQARAPLTVTATGQTGGVPGEEQSASLPTALPAPASPPVSHGRLTFIDNTVDPATATIRLKATFANRDRTLWPGLFVQVALQLSSQPGAIVVPAVAVQASQQGQYVYVVKPDRTVEMRDVTVERQLGDEAVISRGLSGTEEVVTDGQLRLSPGTRVTTSDPAETAS